MTMIRDMDTIDYVIISPNLIVNISNANSELDIPSDQYLLTMKQIGQK